MMLRIKIVTLILTLSCLSSIAQKLKKADKITLANLETHVRYLADDKLEGRRTGSPGEKAASDYIGSSLAGVGLQPKGDNNGWLQAFPVDEGRQLASDAYFMVNDKPLLFNKEYFPLTFSGLGSVSGSPAIALQESGEPWFMDLKEMLENNRSNPHFDLAGAILTKAKECSKKGAAALILYNSSKLPDNLSFDPKDRSEPAVIPLVYITKEAKKKYGKDESASLEIKLKIGFTEKKRTGHNVIGYLDNGAPTTIVIGAHYDHLGHGEDGSTLYTGTDKPVFNGADDNASGVAGIIELARLLKTSKLKKSNYLIIAFSGEELGLFGSKYFVDHPTIDLKKVNYMVNLDMVGRLKDSSRALSIGGFGTSPAWDAICNSVDEKKFFNIRFDSSGAGPSDHTSFYRKDIPVLFFFTGVHSDYHKPTDDYDRINYTGELEVLKFIMQVLEKTNGRDKLAFAATRDQMADAPHFTVTLGIMPDYTFQGSGIRADAVSKDRPAEKAGLKAGDVIIQLGTYRTPDMQLYMEALAAFKKGDTTTVKFRRGTETIEAPVQF